MMKSFPLLCVMLVWPWAHTEKALLHVETSGYATMVFKKPFTGQPTCKAYSRSNKTFRITAGPSSTEVTYAGDPGDILEVTCR